MELWAGVACGAQHWCQHTRTFSCRFLLPGTSCSHPEKQSFVISSYFSLSDQGFYCPRDRYIRLVYRIRWRAGSRSVYKIIWKNTIRDCIIKLEMMNSVDGKMNDKCQCKYHEIFSKMWIQRSNVFTQMIWNTNQKKGRVSSHPWTRKLFFRPASPSLGCRCLEIPFFLFPCQQSEETILPLADIKQKGEDPISADFAAANARGRGSFPSLRPHIKRFSSENSER